MITETKYAVSINGISFLDNLTEVEVIDSLALEFNKPYESVYDTLHDDGAFDGECCSEIRGYDIELEVEQ